MIAVTLSNGVRTMRLWDEREALRAAGPDFHLAGIRSKWAGSDSSESQHDARLVHAGAV